MYESNSFHLVMPKCESLLALLCDHIELDRDIGDDVNHPGEPEDAGKRQVHVGLAKHVEGDDQPDDGRMEPSDTRSGTKTLWTRLNLLTELPWLLRLPLSLPLALLLAFLLNVKLFHLT